MSTYYYSCEKCGDELGSAQDILWLQEKPYHPECATERDRTAEREAAVAELLEAAKAFADDQALDHYELDWNDWNRLKQAIANYVRLRDE